MANEPSKRLSLVLGDGKTVERGNWVQIRNDPKSRIVGRGVGLSPDALAEVVDMYDTTSTGGMAKIVAYAYGRRYEIDPRFLAVVG